MFPLLGHSREADIPSFRAPQCPPFCAQGGSPCSERATNPQDSPHFTSCPMPGDLCQGPQRKNPTSPWAPASAPAAPRSPLPRLTPSVHSHGGDHGKLGVDVRSEAHPAGAVALTADAAGAFDAPVDADAARPAPAARRTSRRTSGTLAPPATATATVTAPVAPFMAAATPALAVPSPWVRCGGDDDKEEEEEEEDR
jgi:hypothetical protein